LHVAQAAALVAMVGRYSDGAKYDPHRDKISAVVDEADVIRARAVGLAADDEAAFTAVSSAYGLSKSTDEEKQQRREAIAEALIGAAEPPIQVIAAASRVVELAAVLIPIGNRNLIADLAAAAEAAAAGAATARVNIEVNMGGVTDPGARARCAASAADVDHVQDAAEKVTAAVRAELVA
jgi:formiminotetrahydrofolate cyclodeaminase